MAVDGQTFGSFVTCSFRMKEMFYLMTQSTHFSYCNRVSDIW